MLSATINKPDCKMDEDQKQSQARANTLKKVIVAPTYERVVPLTHYCWLQSNSHIEKKARKLYRTADQINDKQTDCY